jgi:beta-1,4-mannosyl-glycoprotein beta-1,4-N-acetylglucosaminyltransferase
MKLIDCFMYFDEDLVLDIRLNTLNDYVDKFVIAEATLDHSGREKKLNFDIKNFLKFKDKINYLIIDDMPKEVEQHKKNWHSAHIRDQFQRNSLKKGFLDSVDEDLIMISDIDEIPDPKKISEFSIKNKYACFIQRNFQSKINQLNITSPNWLGTKICQKKYLKSPQWLRNLKTKKKNWWSIFKDKEPQIILNGGWHFSFLKKPNLIQKKIESFAHQEFNDQKFIDIDKIQERVGSLKDIFDREYVYKKIELDNSFPEYILKNTQKFRDWII